MNGSGQPDREDAMLACVALVRRVVSASRAGELPEDTEAALGELVLEPFLARSGSPLLFLSRDPALCMLLACLAGMAAGVMTSLLEGHGQELTDGRLDELEREVLSFCRGASGGREL